MRTGLGIQVIGLQGWDLRTVNRKVTLEIMGVGEFTLKAY